MSQHTTFYGVTTEHSAKLREIAKRLGYIAVQGPTKDEGSASALIRAIANGELIVTKKGDK